MSKVRTFLEMIKFEHTIFALPFAYLGMVLAWGGWERANWPEFVLITVAMAAARTAAMSLNRYIDRFIDAHNPRTARRPIQTGAIDAASVLFFAVLSLVILGVSAWLLNPLAFYLFPGALLFLVGYAYAKRFTWLCHYILGFTDGLAPMGAWVAVRGSVFTTADLPAWLLLAAVTFWIGGFDVIYACQDVEFDRRTGLHSIPARFGIGRGLQIAALNHTLTVLILVILGVTSSLSWPYWLGVAAVAGLLLYEHSLVRPDDLSKLGIAFFNVNGYISVTIFVATFVAVLLG
ncbi:MAG: putative 4-hydroxybenzoate polyprenyltransferase [Chloroflexi bacterium]|nr:putative 4-hydroxybenzoate polyprenyltransferase [Chloroflexota bacterium]MCI0576245.1 putative 4-hydroxybenzoate polyprenyltransferase [Chloroflexota bacterium]MCI0644559.1 putative 4-hydroxybenzoate polyprenyltransferase [Chloroflexota bacterium]MCI0728752.1 putative 4-hydroxybenzoate polyprenyltransferase [Chloroflexota bacterium]